FARKCAVEIPVWLNDTFAKAARDQRTDLLAIAVCSELCSDLIEGGVDALHFYTLNRPELTRDICCSIGITPQASLEKVA
ncbi:MAG: methylenetetrahydrofolate reductase, partial [Paracoccaceae bacterium]